MYGHPFFLAMFLPIFWLSFFSFAFSFCFLQHTSNQPHAIGARTSLASTLSFFPAKLITLLQSRLLSFSSSCLQPRDRAFGDVCQPWLSCMLPSPCKSATSFNLLSAIQLDLSHHQQTRPVCSNVSYNTPPLPCIHTSFSSCDKVWIEDKLALPPRATQRVALFAMLQLKLQRTCTAISCEDLVTSWSPFHFSLSFRQSQRIPFSWL